MRRGCGTEGVAGRGLAIASKHEFRSVHAATLVPVKLIETARVALGERVYLREKSVLLEDDGSVLMIVERQEHGEWRTCIERITEAGVQASGVIPPGAFGATPTIVLLGGGVIAVLSDTATVTVFDRELRPQHTVALDAEWPEPWSGTTAGGIARPGRDGAFLVRLTDPVSFQNSRAIASLRLTEAEGSWLSWRLLARSDFPMSGPRAKGAAGPIVGDVWESDSTRIVIAEGSDSGSVNRYGSDFFTVAELDSDFRIAHRVFEESGWLRLAGKHGMTGRFTAGGASILLRQVFASGSWKGRAHLLDLSDGSLAELPPVRGAAAFIPADVRGSRVVLLSEDSLLFARFDDEPAR